MFNSTILVFFQNKRLITVSNHTKLQLFSKQLFIMNQEKQITGKRGWTNADQKLSDKGEI